MRRLARHAREAFEVPRDLLLGRYPEFVTGGPLPRGQVPVFVFHSLEPEAFGRKLRYLADNGYVTLSADEYFQFLMGTRAVPERAVVLTFDDGRGSLWSVGYPLMRRHGMKGIVFLVPGRTSCQAGVGPTWGENGTEAEAEAVRQRETTDATAFLCWDEIAAMSHSGLFDFQSHTLTHVRVHTAPRVVGFMTPGASVGYRAMDIPLIDQDGCDLEASAVPLGTPLLCSEPRTSEALRFHEDPGFRRACVERVAEEGARFFERRNWRKILNRLLRGQPITGRLETQSHQEAAILRELEASRAIIEQRTGRSVVHLCYPWHSSGPTARRLAREVGYRTSFAGKVRGVRLTLAGGDPHAIARIGEDYVELLPGRGRAELSSVLKHKWKRRLLRAM